MPTSCAIPMPTLSLEATISPGLRNYKSGLLIGSCNKIVESFSCVLLVLLLSLGMIKIKTNELTEREKILLAIVLPKKKQKKTCK
jgi:hypothetical protein